MAYGCGGSIGSAPKEPRLKAKASSVTKLHGTRILWSHVASRNYHCCRVRSNLSCWNQIAAIRKYRIACTASSQKQFISFQKKCVWIRRHLTSYKPCSTFTSSCIGDLQMKHARGQSCCWQLLHGAPSSTSAERTTHDSSDVHGYDRRPWSSNLHGLICIH